MDNLEIAKALFGSRSGTAGNSKSSGQTTTAYGIATSDSVNGIVRVNLGGDTTSLDDDQTIEVETTFAVFEGDEVIVSLIGADGTGKAPVVIGVVGRGDEQQTEINSVTNYVWNDEHGLHVSTAERSVQGANVLIDSDSLDIRNGSSNSESAQTVYASFGREVTVGSRKSGYGVGTYSQVFGGQCVASGDSSHAEGNNTIASGICSHSEGYQTTATGDYSHAEGNLSSAYGAYGHAEGYYTQAGNYGHSEGYRTIAAGGAHAEGLFAQAASRYQHAQGIGNVIDSQYTYLDIIGNGTVDSEDTPSSVTQRSNAYNLDRNGNAEFQGEVYLGGCTPNGETPYPAVRYNTSNSQQEYYDGSAWAQVPGGGGGGGSWTELWTNSAPSSDFSARTVPLDLSGWNLIAILGKTSTSGTAYNITFIMPNGDTFIMTVGNATSTQYWYKRTVSADANGVTFSTGYRNTTGTSGASYCIPVAIYGVA